MTTTPKETAMTALSKTPSEPMTEGALTAGATDRPSARSGVRTLLQAEGLPILAAGAIAYGQLGGPWLALVPLMLMPDLSMVGFLRDAHLGSLTYNLGHNLVTAGALLAVGLGLNIGWLAIAGAVVVAHIGMDRLLGYGLKYPSAFKDTHLQHV